MQCIHCKQEFISKRIDAKYCSTKCRVAYSRLSVTDKPVTDNQELDVTDNVTDKLPQYYCKACKRNLKELSTVPELICICRDCVNEGKKHDDWCDCKPV